MRLVAFILGIYHDALSPKRQIPVVFTNSTPLMNECSAFFLWPIDKQGDKTLRYTNLFFAAHFTGSYSCKSLTHFSMTHSLVCKFSAPNYRHYVNYLNQ
jgi:hypothetical protein